MRHEDMDLVLYGVDSIFSIAEEYFIHKLDSKEIPEAVIKYIDLDEDRAFDCTKRVKVKETVYEKKKFQPPVQNGLATRSLQKSPNEFPQIVWWVIMWIYLSWAFLNIKGYVKMALCKLGLTKHNANKEYDQQKDFVPLYSSFESFYTRFLYMCRRDVFERPICSTPGARTTVLERTTKDNGWTFQFTGKKIDVINVGSYNYLGFAENKGPCAEAAASAVDCQGISTCSTTLEGGQYNTQKDLETLVAKFIGVEDAICFSMGFATNSSSILCLVDEDCLIVSDEKNHASLILGCRLSKCPIRVFKHNDVKDLEKVLREAILLGNRRGNRGYKPYKKILIVVEGIYSMEGSICHLPEIIALKKKYNCYLYLDEAHSIGALGKSGRGVVEYWECNPKDVDVMMGTFTKSFGGFGGYIGGSRALITHLRKNSPLVNYSQPLTAAVIQQITHSMRIMDKNESNEEGIGTPFIRTNTYLGQKRVRQLAENVHYFREKMKNLGFVLYGSDDSPVVPMLIYFPEHLINWGRESFKREIGCVVVSYPATSMIEARARICISAAHTKEMLDEVLEKFSRIGDEMGLKFSYAVVH